MKIRVRCKDYLLEMEFDTAETTIPKLKRKLDRDWERHGHNVPPLATIAFYAGVVSCGPRNAPHTLWGTWEMDMTDGD